MLSKKDELYIKLKHVSESDQDYIVRLLEEKTRYYEKRIKEFEDYLNKNQYDNLAVKQAEKHLNMFKDMVEYNRVLTDKVR